jgi:hypothetical protein
MSEHDGNGRGARGLFAPGNKFSKGNVGHRRMAELRRALFEAATEDDVREVYRAMVTAAKGGDVAAARVVLEHLLGKPRQQVELSGVDGEPLGLDLASLMKVVLVALAGHPEAKLAVSEALGRAIDGPGDVAAGGA